MKAQGVEPVKDVVRHHRGSVPVRRHLCDDASKFDRVRDGEFTEQLTWVHDSAGPSDVRGGEVSDVASEQDVGAPTSRGGSMDVVVRVGSGHRRNEMLICGGVDPSLRCGGSHLRAEDGSVRSTESLSLDQDAFDLREGLVGSGEVEQADLDTAQHEVG